MNFSELFIVTFGAQFVAAACGVVVYTVLTRRANKAAEPAYSTRLK